MAEPRARQDYRRETRISEMDCNTSRDQVGLARHECDGLVDACVQIEPGRAGSRIAGKPAAHSLIEDFDVEPFHNGFKALPPRTQRTPRKINITYSTKSKW